MNRNNDKLAITPEVQRNSLYQDLQEATHLTISNFQDWDSVIAITKFVSTTKILHTVEFDHIENEFTIDNITDLLIRLSQVSSIYSFKLTNCNFSGSNGENLAFCLSDWMPNLHYVGLSNNNIGTAYTAEAVKYLLKLPYIIKIDASNNFPMENDFWNNLRTKREKVKIHDMVEERNLKAKENCQSSFEKANFYLKSDHCQSNEIEAYDAKKMILKQYVDIVITGDNVLHTVDVTYE